MGSAKLNVIITGATGMVGEGVLHESLNHPLVESVLVVTRKPAGVSHPKLREIIHRDFFNLHEIEESLTGYNACFFCLGTTSVGKKEDEYYNTTYNLTINFAKAVCNKNPGLTFCYISGAGTDSTEKGSLMWARVKGKTENDLMKMPFKKVFALRPGFIKPIRGQKHVNPLYKYIGWLFPIGRMFYPAGFCRMEELALAMINLVNSDFDRKVIEGKEIILLGNKPG
jgi:uncharacterized protein YbjT (DUF2867 family)